MTDAIFVKVCGLRALADVEVAVEAGADAIGFVWYEPSPRHLELDEIRRLARRTPVKSVLVTAGLDSATLLDAAGRAEVDVIQPHGSRVETPPGFEVIRPVSAGDEIGHVRADELLLIDAPDPEMVGGRGATFDWNLTESVDRPFLLAGGLGPDNVAAAIRKVRPFGVDASSGLESSPGQKDPDLIRRFVEEAKRT